MIGFYLMCGVLIVIAAGLIHLAVNAAGFWGALAMAGVFAALLATAASACPA